MKVIKGNYQGTTNGNVTRSRYKNHPFQTESGQKIDYDNWSMEYYDYSEKIVSLEEVADAVFGGENGIVSPFGEDKATYK